VSKVVAKSSEGEISARLFIRAKRESKKILAHMLKATSETQGDMCGPKRVDQTTVLCRREDQMHEAELSDAP